LWTRDLSLYFTARSISTLGDALMPVATALGVGGLYGATGVGVVLAVWTAPIVALVLFGGVLSDRFGARRLMIGADVVRIVAQGVTALAFFSGAPPLWLLIGASAVAGSATAMFAPGASSTVPLVARDVQRANATMRVADSLAMLAGPGLAGVLITLAGAGVIYLIDAATFAVSALCLLLLRVRVPLAAAHSVLNDLKVGWYEFWSRPWMWSVILVWMVFGLLVFGPLIPVGSALISGRLGGAAYGWVESALGGGTIVGGLIALKLRPARPLAAGAVATFGFALLPLVYGSRQPLILLLVGSFVAGIAWAFWTVMWATSVQTQVAPEVLNRVTAYEVAGSVSGIAVGQAAAGPLAAAVGGERLMLVSAVVCLAGCVVLLALPAVRNLKRRNDPEPAGLETAPA
jgi:predicted MFS family arabinose efflux permease